MCVEEEATEHPLLEEDELYMVYDVTAISRLIIDPCSLCSGQRIQFVRMPRLDFKGGH